MTGFARQTVYNAIKRFREIGTLEDRPRNGHPPIAVTPANVIKVRCRIRRNSRRSMNKMEKEIGISRQRVCRTVEKKLKMRSYKLGRGHFLTDAMTAKI